jgi:uncharacterized protein (UPF0332 family)
MTIDQENLLRKAEVTAQAAKSLAAGGYTDSAVSRAYYAMFYSGFHLPAARGTSW